MHEVWTHSLAGSANALLVEVEISECDIQGIGGVSGDLYQRMWMYPYNGQIELQVGVRQWFFSRFELWYADLGYAPWTQSSYQIADRWMTVNGVTQHNTGLRHGMSLSPETPSLWSSGGQRSYFDLGWDGVVEIYNEPFAARWGGVGGSFTPPYVVVTGSIFSIFWSGPVPEPASGLAIAFGFAAILSRRKKQ